MGPRKNSEPAEASVRLMGNDPAARSAIPVLVVEDNRMLRDGIVSLLNQHADLDVAAVAEGADAALRHLTDSPRGGVVLVDASLADHATHSLVQRIREVAPEAAVIVMDLVPAHEDVVEFIKAGAAGLIAKDAAAETFVETIRSVAEGRKVIPSALTGTLFSHVAQNASRRPMQKRLGAVRMTRREQEIIGLIADGLSNKEIARQLHISPHTVKSHVRNILEKLALHSRLQLAAYVHQADKQAESE